MNLSYEMENCINWHRSLYLMSQGWVNIVSAAVYYRILKNKYYIWISCIYALPVFWSIVKTRCMYLNLAFSSFYIICDSFNHMHELEITHGYYAPGSFLWVFLHIFDHNKLTGGICVWILSLNESKWSNVDFLSGIFSVWQIQFSGDALNNNTNTSASFCMTFSWPWISFQSTCFLLCKR